MNEAEEIRPGKFKLSPEEEDQLETFLIDAYYPLQGALEKKKAGRFTILAMVADMAKWYNDKEFVTTKQYDQLKKHVFDKMNDPAYIRKHLKEVMEIKTFSQLIQEIEIKE